MRLMLSYLKRYKGLVFLNFISVFGFALTELGIPTIISRMVDGGVASGDREYLLKMGGLIALISVVGILGTVVLGYCGARISTAVTCDIRNDLFEKVQSFSHREMNQLGVSSLITRTSNDALQIMNFMNIILRTAMLTPVMIAVSFTLIIMSSVKLSLIIAATVPFIILGVILVAKISGPVSERQQTALDGLNRIFRENLTGIRVIRSFNNDARETERFGEQNQAFTNQSKKLFTLMSSTEPLFFSSDEYCSIGDLFCCQSDDRSECAAGGAADGVYGIPVSCHVLSDAVLPCVHDVSPCEYFGQTYRGSDEYDAGYHK